MADWTDGSQYAPVERPQGFATPRTEPLPSAEAETKLAAGRPPLAPTGFEDPEKEVPLVDLAPATGPERDPRQPFETVGTGDSAWGSAHAATWNPRMPLSQSADQAPQDPTQDQDALLGAPAFPPPAGPPVVPAPGAQWPQQAPAPGQYPTQSASNASPLPPGQQQFPTPQGPTAQGPVAQGPMPQQLPPPTGAPVPLPPPTTAFPPAAQQPQPAPAPQQPAPQQQTPQQSAPPQTQPGQQYPVGAWPVPPMPQAAPRSGQPSNQPPTQTAVPQQFPQNPNPQAQFPQGQFPQGQPGPMEQWAPPQQPGASWQVPGNAPVPASAGAKDPVQVFLGGGRGIALGVLAFGVAVPSLAYIMLFISSFLNRHVGPGGQLLRVAYNLIFMVLLGVILLDLTNPGATLFPGLGRLACAVMIPVSLWASHREHRGGARR